MHFYMDWRHAWISTGYFETVSERAASSMSYGQPAKTSSSLDSHLPNAVGVIWEAFGPSTSSSVLLYHTYISQIALLLSGVRSSVPTKMHENFMSEESRPSLHDLSCRPKNVYDQVIGMRSNPAKRSWRTLHRLLHTCHKPPSASSKIQGSPSPASHREQ